MLTILYNITSWFRDIFYAVKSAFDLKNVNSYKLLSQIRIAYCLDVMSGNFLILRIQYSNKCKYIEIVKNLKKIILYPEKCYRNKNRIFIVIKFTHSKLFSNSSFWVSYIERYIQERNILLFYLYLRIQHQLEACSLQE